MTIVNHKSPKEISIPADVFEKIGHGGGEFTKKPSSWPEYKRHFVEGWIAQLFKKNPELADFTFTEIRDHSIIELLNSTQEPLDSTPMKATSFWWMTIKYNDCLILDPDGWDRKDLSESMNEMITEEEFLSRRSASTLMELTPEQIESNPTAVVDMFAEVVTDILKART